MSHKMQIKMFKSYHECEKFISDNRDIRKMQIQHQNGVYALLYSGDSEDVPEADELCTIKELLNSAVRHYEDNNFEDMRNDMEQLFTESLIDWAVEQIVELREKRDEYEKALEFYASPYTWIPDETHYSDADKYKYNIAKYVLEKYSDKERLS